MVQLADETTLDAPPRTLAQLARQLDLAHWYLTDALRQIAGGPYSYAYHSAVLMRCQNWLSAAQQSIASARGRL
jgi:hypothetical protein